MTFVNVSGVALPALPELEAPLIEGAVYEFHLRLFQVHGSGQLDQDRYLNLTQKPDDAKEALVSSQGLAWVQLYAKALATLKHPESLQKLLPPLQREKPTATIYGPQVRIGEPSYLVGRTGEGLVFLSREQILAEGALRPYMATWVSRLLHGAYRSHAPAWVHSLSDRTNF